MCVGGGGGGGGGEVPEVKGYRERPFDCDTGNLTALMTLLSCFPSSSSLLFLPSLLLSSSPSHLSSLHFLPGRGFPEIEDEENWHGKPLGQKAQAALDAVNALIKNPKPHGLSPLPFKDDAPPVVLPQVKLSEPPNYKLGEKVCVCVLYQ